MSTKNQISSWCKLYSIYEEIPEDFLDETDVDSYFCHNILDISQSHYWIVRVSKGSNKKSFAFKVFQFCDSKLQQRFILKEEVSISKKEIESLLDSLSEIFQSFWSSQQSVADSFTQTQIWDWIYKSKRRTVQSLLQGYSWAFKQTNYIIVSIPKEQDLRLFYQKVWTIRWSILSYRSCQPELPRNQTSLQEWNFCCLQVWYFWEQLQCVVHSLLIVGMTIVLLFSLGMCIVQIQSVWVNFACTKRLFNLLAEAIINSRKARLCVKCAIFFWRSNKFLFLIAWSWGLHFWRESKINSRCHWRCVLPRWVLSQQREMQIYWWLCNNSEIHLWLWQLWSLVVCSKSSVHVTRARKDDKNRQNTLCLC